MIQRALLCQEIPQEKVFIAQKWMTEKANIQAKPIIVASQILDSMIKQNRPLRTEASDISNAVQDGADSVMLTEETAHGNYPT